MANRDPDKGQPWSTPERIKNMKHMPPGVWIKALFILYKAAARENRPSGKLINRSMNLTQAWETLRKADAKSN